MQVTIEIERVLFSEVRIYLGDTAFTGKPIDHQRSWLAWHQSLRVTSVLRPPYLKKAYEYFPPCPP